VSHKIVVNSWPDMTDNQKHNALSAYYCWW